jgi:CTP synthase (UTP-ammonia lyase)
LGFEDAEHGEYNPNASRLFISELTCSLAGRDMNIELEPGSQVNTMYGSANVQEKYYCNFGVNPDHIDDIKNSQFRVAGSDDESEIRIIELPGHRFFIGTLFVPQAQSTPERPHPLINGFISAVAEPQVL